MSEGMDLERLRGEHRKLVEQLAKWQGQQARLEELLKGAKQTVDNTKKEIQEMMRKFPELAEGA